MSDVKVAHRRRAQRSIPADSGVSTDCLPWESREVEGRVGYEIDERSETKVIDPRIRLLTADVDDCTTHQAKAQHSGGLGREHGLSPVGVS